MQVVERRLERAAEVVPVPLLWRGARQGGVVESRLGGYGHPALSPHTGHPVHKPAAERSPGRSASRADGLIQSFQKLKII